MYIYFLTVPRIFNTKNKSLNAGSIFQWAAASSQTSASRQAAQAFAAISSLPWVGDREFHVNAVLLHFLLAVLKLGGPR